MPARRLPPRLSGPVTRSGARAAGIGDEQLRHPGVARLSRDTYLPRALLADVDARLAAVLLTLPEGAVASHRTAAALWGLEIPLQDPADRRIDVTVPCASRAESRRDRRVFRCDLSSDETTQRRLLPVTTPARTWRDLAAVLERPALLAVTDQLLVRRCTRDELEDQLTARPRGRGCARAREVLPLADRRAESPMESVLRWLLHEAGLPAPVLQHQLHDGAGRFLGRGDLVWPYHRVLVEFDGDVHRDRDVFVKDLRRQNGLVGDGWVVLRYSSADVRGRPEQVVAEIRRALRRATSALSWSSRP